MNALDYVSDLYSQLNPGIWIACAVILFCTTTAFLRFTKVRWIWSMVGGIVGILVYSLLIFLSYMLFETFLTAMSLG